MSKKTHDMKRRAYSGEFIQDQLRSNENEAPDAMAAENSTPNRKATKEIGVEGVEPNSNVFASGHMVDPIINMYDFDATVFHRNIIKDADQEAADQEAPEENAEIQHCGPEVESHFPESRDVHLGLLGLQKQADPPIKTSSAVEASENKIVEWYLKRRPNFRPAWGQLHIW